jgi:hypothetical protein
MKTEKVLLVLILYIVVIAIYKGDWQYIPAMLSGALYILIYIYEHK